MELPWPFQSCALRLTGIYYLIPRNQVWRIRKGEFEFLYFLVNPCFGENFISTIRCSLEPALYFS